MGNRIAKKKTSPDLDCSNQARVNFNATDNNFIISIVLE